MDDMTLFEARFEERLRAFASTGVRSMDSAAVARVVAAGHPRSAGTQPARRRLLDETHRTRQRSMLRTVFAAAAIVALVALGGALVIGRPGPTPSPQPSPSLPGVVAPSSTPPATAPTPSAVTSPAGVWIATGTMITPRQDPSAVRLLDGRVLVVGGANGDGTYTSDTSAEVYDPENGTWSATGNLLKPLGGRSPATLLRDGRVLVFGDDGPEVYDPKSGAWTATGKMVWGGGGTATLLRDGTVLVRGDNGSELFDPISGTWTATRSTAAQRHSHAAILLPDGRVLVVGGHVGGDTPTDSAELYDPDTESWTATASMHAEREAIEAFLQPDGTVLVVGGSDRSGPQSVESYDPATGAWTVTGDLSRPSISASAALLSDRRVLVLPRGDLTDVDLYDPGTRSWAAAAPMLRSHDSAAILLLDGTVLVAGGHDCLAGAQGVCVASGSAELYVPRSVSPPALPAFPSPPAPVFPSPTPVPTPYPPQAGIVPSGARTWTVKAVNKSSEPLALFVAEEDETGLGRSCGSVTPSVVPPDTTMRVTFLLPPKRVETCWIWVNPVPGEGALFQTSDAPMKGEIHVMADGQVGWLSP